MQRDPNKWDGTEAVPPRLRHMNRVSIPNSSLDFFAIDGLGPWAIAHGQLGFQLGDAGFQRRDIVCDLGHSEARGDVLRTVPVVRNDLDEE